LGIVKKQESSTALKLEGVCRICKFKSI